MSNDASSTKNAAFPHKKAHAALVAAPLPKGDLFARENIEGMLGLEPDVIKKRADGVEVLIRELGVQKSVEKVRLD